MYILIEAGTIKQAYISGETIVSRKPASEELIPKRNYLKYQKYTELKGTRFGSVKLLAKYHVTLSVIQRWVVRGYIARLGKEKNKILLNEQ